MLFIATSSQQIVSVDGSQIQQLSSMIPSNVQIEALINDIALKRGLRKTATASLLAYCQPYPNELIDGLVFVLLNTNSLQCREVSAVYLRRFLTISSQNPTPSQNMWPKLSAAMKKKITHSIFTSLQNESSLELIQLVGKMIGVLSEVSMQTEQEKVFTQNLIGLFDINKKWQTYFGGLVALQNTRKYNPCLADALNAKLLQILQYAFEHDELQIRVAAVKILPGFIQYVKDFDGSLISTLFDSVYSLIHRNNNIDGLEVLTKILQIKPFFFISRQKDFFQLLTRITRIFPTIHISVFRLTLQIMLNFTEKYPITIGNDPKLIETAVQMVFFYMGKIDSNTDQNWSSGNYLQEDLLNQENMKIILFGLNCIKRLFIIDNTNKILSLLKIYAAKLFESSEWHHIYIAIMAFSQVGYSHEASNKIFSEMKIIVGCLRNKHPMLRFAAWYAINELAAYKHLKIQSQYGDDISIVLLKTIELDQYPRVAYMAIHAFSNHFIAHYHQSGDDKRRIERFKHLIFNRMVCGTVLINEATAKSVISIASTCKEAILQDYKEIFSILLGFQTIIKNHDIINFRRLNLKIIKYLIDFGDIALNQLLQNYEYEIKETVVFLIELQEAQQLEAIPQTQTFFQCWKCLIRHSYDITHALRSNIIQILLQKITKQIQLDVKNINLAKEQAKEIDSQIKLEQQSMDEQQSSAPLSKYVSNTSSALSLLETIIRKAKGLSSNTMGEIIRILFYTHDNHPSSQVKQQVFKCFVPIAQTMENYKLIDVVKFARQIIKRLGKEIKKNILTNIVSIVKNIKIFLELFHAGILKAEEGKLMAQIFKEHFKQCRKKCQLLRKNIEESKHSDERNSLLEKMQQVGQIQLSIMELSRTMMRSYLGTIGFLVESLRAEYDNFIYSQGKPFNAALFGCSLVPCLMEYDTTYFFEFHGKDVIKKLVIYLGSQKCKVRKAAIQSIDILLTNTYSILVAPESQRFLLNRLKVASLTPMVFFNQKEENLSENYISYFFSVMNVLSLTFSMCQLQLDIMPDLLSWVQQISLIVQSYQREAIKYVDRAIDILKQELNIQKPGLYSNALVIIGRLIDLQDTTHTALIRKKIKNCIFAILQNPNYIRQDELILDIVGMETFKKVIDYAK